MARKRAQLPSVDVLFGYSVGQSHKTGSLPTLDEYLFHLGPTKQEQKAEDEDFQVVVAPNLRATTSTNPKRPRTIKAGYDNKTQTMTVVFRDGTWWNYYDVPMYIWQGFVRSEEHTSELQSH